MNVAARLYATCFGLGLVPLAPGTAASLAMVLLYRFFLSHWPTASLAALILLMTAAGVPAASACARELGQTDPRRIVIDEASGQLCVLLLAPSDWVSLGAAFVLFRFFDVLKPYPIRKLERLPGGWGIMADDLAAAAYGWIALRLGILIFG